MANIKDPTVGFDDPREARDLARELLSGSKTGSIDKGSARFAYKEAAAKLDLNEDITPGQRAEVLKRVSGSLAGHIKRPRRYTAPINELESLFAATTMEELGEVNAKISHQEYLNNRNENAEAFENWSSSTLANEFGTLSKQYIQKQKNERMQNWESNFGAVADIIDNNPEELVKTLPGFTSEMRGRMNAAGFDRGQIDRKVKDIESSAIEIAFHSLNRTDPKAAEAFASSNADALGMKVVNLKNTARRAQASLEKEARKAQLEEAKAGFRGLNADQIAEMETQKGPMGDAARETSRNISQNPFKLLGKNPTPLNFNVMETLEDRVAEVDALEESYSTPNRPVEIPYFDKSNIDNMKINMAISPARAQKVFGFLTSLGEAETEKMVRGFGKDPLGAAVRIYKYNPKVAMEILEGTLSDSKATISPDMMAKRKIHIYKNPALNTATFKAMEALSKVRPTDSAQELAEKVANVQDVESKWFKSNKIALPHGMDGDGFKSTMKGLLSDPARMKEYANGTMRGGDVDIDYDDLDFEAASPGIYHLKNDGRYVITEDGFPYTINLGRVLSDG